MRFSSAGILFILLTVSTSCGGEPESPVGEWKAETGLDRRASSRRPITCGFNEDGTCWGRVGRLRATGTWKQDGNTIVVTPHEERYAAVLKPKVTIDDGVLTVEVAVRGRDYVYVFKRQ